MKSVHIVLLLFVLVNTGCSLKEYRLFQGDETSGDPTIVTDKEYEKEISFEYKIQPNDRVSIQVFNQIGSSNQITSIVDENAETRISQEGSSGFLVTRDGTILLPLVGSVKLSGLTEDQAAKYLIEKYKLYLRNPYAVVKINNQRIIIVGEVNRPGVVPITNGTMNLIEVIARSGDLTNWAMRTHVVILRGDLRKPETRIVDLTDMSAIALSSLYLQDKDIVYVQPRSAKGISLFVEDISPPFELISRILTPFVLIDTLNRN